MPFSEHVHVICADIYAALVKSRDWHKLAHVLRGQMLTLPFRGTYEVLRVLQYRYVTMLIRSSYILYFAMITSVAHAAEFRCDTNQNRIGEKVFDTISYR